MKTEFPDRYITLGLKIAFIGQIEGTGTIRGVSLETLFKISHVLNISPSKLLEND